MEFFLSPVAAGTMADVVVCVPGGVVTVVFPEELLLVWGTKAMAEWVVRKTRRRIIVQHVVLLGVAVVVAVAVAVMKLSDFMVRFECLFLLFMIGVVAIEEQLPYKQGKQGHTHKRPSC